MVFSSSEESPSELLCLLGLRRPLALCPTTERLSFFARKLINFQEDEKKSLRAPFMIRSENKRREDESVEASVMYVCMQKVLV